MAKKPKASKDGVEIINFTKTVQFNIQEEKIDRIFNKSMGNLEMLIDEYSYLFESFRDPATGRINFKDIPNNVFYIYNVIQKTVVDVYRVHADVVEKKREADEREKRAKLEMLTDRELKNLLKQDEEKILEAPTSSLRKKALKEVADKVLIKQKELESSDSEDNDF